MVTFSSGVCVGMYGLTYSFYRPLSWGSWVAVAIIITEAMSANEKQIEMANQLDPETDNQANR